MGAAATWPLGARAQQPAKLPTIGFLGASTPAAIGQWVAAFVQRLRELGWIENRTVAIEYRWAEGRSERYAEIAAEFVRLKVDVIVTHSAEPVLAANQATSVIPIVFGAAADPVASGLVASLGRPGGNVTGLSVQFTDLAGKQLELLREVVPGLRRLAIMLDIGNSGAVLEMGKVQTAARILGVERLTLEIRRAEDIAPAFETLKGRAEALYVRRRHGHQTIPPGALWSEHGMPCSCNRTLAAAAAHRATHQGRASPPGATSPSACAWTLTTISPVLPSPTAALAASVFSRAAPATILNSPGRTCRDGAHGGSARRADREPHLLGRAPPPRRRRTGH